MLIALILLTLIISVGIFVLFISRSALTTKTNSIGIDGLNRSYNIHLPNGFDKNKKYPLVIVLHALGDGPRLIELNSGMSKIADKEKFIVIYPKGTGQRLSWNAGFCCSFAFENHIDDIKYLDEVIKKVKSEYHIENEEMFIAGLSNGGMMAYQYVSHNPDFKGIAVIAGTLGSDKQTVIPPKTSIPLLAIHGKEDKLVPYGGGGEYNFLSVEESVLRWPGENKKIMTVEDRGHLWFGGLQDYILNRKIPKVYATDLIWEFFSNIK